MGMCKGCGKVFSSIEMKDGLCESCSTPENIEQVKKNAVELKSKNLSKVNLKHKDTGVLKTVPVGYSWTTFFFGGFVPLFRGDIKWFFLELIIQLLTLGIGTFYLVFFYNKIYIKELMEKGYVPADEASRLNLLQRKIIS